MKPLCIYHGNCADGFGAAWAVREALGADNVDFHAGVYQDPPPDVQGRDVIMVDFSYKRPVMWELAQRAKSVLVLDHHRSAYDDLGDLPRSAEVPLSNGKVAYVDESDLALVSQYSWSEHVRGGAIAYVGGGRDDPKYTYMHQLILPPKDGLIIDHRNRNGLDNRRANLRYATKHQNGANMDRGSAFKGVTPRGDRWVAQITVNGEHRYLGMFESAEQAAQAYDSAARAEWGDYARCNFGQADPFPPNCCFIFDMDRSGAGLAWDYFHPGRPRPRLIDHIEDRDLWRFALPHTREILAALFSYPYDFETWSALVETVEADPERLICEGAAIERKHHKDIAELVQVVVRPMKFRAPWLDGPAPADLGFVVVPMANLPYTLASDAGHLLCGDEHPFAGCFWFTPEGWVFSLRSKEGGADVGEIAKQYGGGGHRHAAGFRIPLNKLGEFCAGV